MIGFVFGLLFFANNVANHNYYSHHRFATVNLIDATLFHVSDAELIYHRKLALDMQQQFEWNGEISLERTTEQSRSFIIWDRVYQLRFGNMTNEYKLDYLNELYEKLGERDYFSGLLPGSVCEEK